MTDTGIDSEPTVLAASDNYIIMATATVTVTVTASGDPSQQLGRSRRTGGSYATQPIDGDLTGGEDTPGDATGDAAEDEPEAD